ncbi:Stp1/IreP family PP2C-type Ser/Thr phosphatase [Xylocopilactobacillus apicola]|uniref:Serine/threonine protein phosphatase n=1 Tax=Xylocopilactobacillus apicola TaxID=2932184 RepID=A0AAU9DW35_9LACO|nr:Stp1/IreP family PP2C-type Ser/Thr phosphatase [Xylocopilactobacillus apicola]BDR58158.1 serine/threonine protein phosphatase [Xylocopilactobacillus apicola]
MNFFQKTDIGLKRENNEDAIGVFTNKSKETLAMIADGMGGHLGGDVASNIALELIGRSFEQTDLLSAQEFVNWLDPELFKVNDTIIEMSQHKVNLYGMGTTFVGAFLSLDQKIVFANLGDTRGYLFHEGTLNQITVDQTLANELFYKGELSAFEAENFPKKNIITSSLGVDKRVDTIYKTLDFMAEDKVLLSSDGLTNMVSDDVIAAKLGSDLAPEQMVNELVQIAIDNGGLDNVSLILGVNDEGSDQS